MKDTRIGAAMGRRLAIMALLAGASLTAACGAGSSASDETDGSNVASNTVIDKYDTIQGTVGPNGEEPTPIADVTLSEAQSAKIASGDYRAAILWHELSAWSQAIQDGMIDELDKLNIDVVATADAKFDAATQANQIENALAKKPDVILGQAVDPTTAATAYGPAVNAGVKLIYADQAPEGFTHGDEYQAVITDDIYQIGSQAGAAMCDAIGGEGKVAMLYFDADFHVTNFRDAVFQQTLDEDCPGAELVAKEGFSDPNKAEEISNAMIARHPDLAGVYTSWAVPGQGVLASLRNAGNAETQVVTIDLDDTMAADMVSESGSTYAIVVDQAYDYGRAMARSAALAILGEIGPEYGVADVLTVTAENVEDGYAAWNQDVPSSVRQAAE